MAKNEMKISIPPQPGIPTARIEELATTDEARQVARDVIRAFDANRDGTVTEDEALDVFQSDPDFNILEPQDVMKILRWHQVPYLDPSCTLVSAETSCPYALEQYENALTRENSRLVPARNFILSLQDFLGWRGEEIYPIELAVVYEYSTRANPTKRQNNLTYSDVHATRQAVHSTLLELARAFDDLRSALSAASSDETCCETEAELNRRFDEARGKLTAFGSILTEYAIHYENDFDTLSEEDRGSFWVELSVYPDLLNEFMQELAGLEETRIQLPSCDD